jgi:hypothetical protein
MEIWLIANYRAILIDHYATTFLKPPYSHRHLSVSSDKFANGLSVTLWAMSSCCGDLPKPRSNSISMAFSWSAGRTCWFFPWPGASLHRHVGHDGPGDAYQGIYQLLATTSALEHITS